jgi:hypothetical protein
LLGRCSTSWATFPALFCIDYFWDHVSCFCSGNPPTYASLIVGITAVNHPVQLLLLFRWGLVNILPGWPQTTIFLISASQVTGIIDMIQHNWLIVFLNFKIFCVFINFMIYVF